MRLLQVIALLLWAAPALAQNDAASLYALGLQYHEGDGVLQDYSVAATHLRAAADMGHASAQNLLGRYHFEGHGVAKDRAAALRLLEAAAAEGTPRFIYDLAQVLETDPSTLPRAAQAYEMAAEAGLADAAVSLGVLYQNGHGVAQDFDRARTLYEPSAAQGHPRAMNNLGLLYVRGNGVEQDYARAATLFKAAAEQGLPQAMTNLAVLYENGFGVPLDEARAIELYRAAGQGTTPPTTFVYDPRLIALPPETDRETLAYSSDPVAQFQWAWLVLTQDSPAADQIQAAYTFKRIAEQGHAPSMLNLGLLYLRGVGVPQDYVLGYKWLLLAQARGVATANEARTAALPLLTADQVNEAQRRAQQFSP